MMARTATIAKKLRKIAASLEELATAMEKMPKSKGVFPAGNGKSAPTRTRSSKKEVAALKMMLKAERKAGVSVAELAAKHGLSKAYVYMVK